MTRNIIAWLLIVAGLTATVGGLGSFYISSIAAEMAPKEEIKGMYIGAGASVAVGLLLLFLGFRLRASSDELKKPRQRIFDPGAAPKKRCAACGGLSPAAATKCYHCGQALPEHGG